MTETDDPRSLNLSWSQLRAHEECKQKSFLLRSGHRSKAGDLRAYFHGMVVDRVMNAWLSDPDRVSGAMVGMVTAAIDETANTAVAEGDGVVRWRHPHDRAELTEFCVELATRLEPLLSTHVLPYPFAAHIRFKTPVRVPYLDGEPVVVNLTGEMDLLVSQPDGHVIWDLKCTRDDQYWRKVLGQLIFYDVADFLATGVRTVKVGLLQPTCKQPVLEWMLTDELRRGMQARIIAMARDIWAQEVACKADTHGCTYCVVRHACARYAATGNRIPFSTPTTPRPSTLAEGLRAQAAGGSP